MNADAAAYLDSSALVKLVVAEAESEALTGHLRKRANRVSCALARVEVVRAVASQGHAATARARRLIAHTRLVRLDDVLLDEAAALDGAVLRSPDAIHLAAARALGSALAEVITYDRRMAEAARGLGLPVASPR